MSRYPSFCCQQCGDPIGWLGRLFGMHRCAPSNGALPGAFTNAEALFRAIEAEEWRPSPVFAWLSKAAKCGDPRVEAAALTMQDYYQGYEPPPESTPERVQADFKAAYRMNVDNGVADYD